LFFASATYGNINSSKLTVLRLQARASLFMRAATTSKFVLQSAHDDFD
jgi:hypothetical protein